MNQLALLALFLLLLVNSAWLGIWLNLDGEVYLQRPNILYIEWVESLKLVLSCWLFIARRKFHADEGYHWLIFSQARFRNRSLKNEELPRIPNEN